MILLFQLIALTSIWVLGLTIITQEGMVLYSVREWANKKGAWVEPVIRCEWCMPSLHSMIGYGFAVSMRLIPEFSWVLVAMYPLVAMGSSLVNGLIWAWYKKIEAEIKFYKSATDDSILEKLEKAYEEMEEDEEYKEPKAPTGLSQRMGAAPMN